MTQRRSLLKVAALAALPAPAIAQRSGVLKDLAVLDPLYTTAYVTRNHAFLVFDTLSSLNNA